MEKQSTANTADKAPLISVLVPVYNTQAFLPACVDSILNQTYSPLEVILVNDGSTDESAALCDAYAARDSRVRVIHQKNGGLSAARNAGLDGCGVLWGFRTAQELKEAGARYLVAAPSELEALVLGRPAQKER